MGSCLLMYGFSITGRWNRRQNSSKRLERPLLSLDIGLHSHIIISQGAVVISSFSNKEINHLFTVKGLAQLEPCGRILFLAILNIGQLSQTEPTAAQSKYRFPKSDIVTPKIETFFLVNRVKSNLEEVGNP